MNEAAETKVCPFCAETVKAAAKKCPYCNSMLIRHAVFRQEFVLGLALTVVAGGFVFVCASIWPDDSDDGGRNFARHRKDLEVKNVTVSVENRGTNADHYNVAGVVTNKGEHPWRVEEFELTLTNTHGTVDVVHDGVNDPFVVQPHTEHEFIFHCFTILTNSIVAASAKVEGARDGNLRKKDD